MTTRRLFLSSGALLAVGAVTAGTAAFKWAPASAAAGPVYPVTHTDAEWQKLLTPDQYAILRQAGTETPFTSPLLNEERAGIFACVGCSNNLYSSTTKFDSGTGWPSFWAPLDKAVATNVDNSFDMVRTAVDCARCGGHLGHVFDDGPQPTGLRYCMNGIALKFNQAQT